MKSLFQGPGLAYTSEARELEDEVDGLISSFFYKGLNRGYDPRELLFMLCDTASVVCAEECLKRQVKEGRRLRELRNQQIQDSSGS